MPQMIKIFCPFCGCEIKASDIDGEISCPDCGRRFPVETGDACYQKTSTLLHERAAHMG